ncbi:MAG TPA: beta-1,6-N-acetylglucosaminyltransferase, partial [Burkholderiaceae bacterium]
MRIAVLLLCHEAPGAIAEALGSAFYRSPDVKVYLHHDLGSPHHERAAFEAAIPAHVQWQWLEDAVRGRWGEYTLVEATLRLMEASLADAAFGAQRLLLASGSCRPMRPLASLQA